MSAKMQYMAISATPIADRCVKLEIQPFNIYRLTLAVELPYLRAQWISMWQHHRMPLFQQVSSSNWSTVSASILKWKRMGATTAQPQSGMPHKLKERDSWLLKCVAYKKRLSSVATLITEFQTASGSNFITGTVRQELVKWVSMAKQPQIFCVPVRSLFSR